MNLKLTKIFDRYRIKRSLIYFTLDLENFELSASPEGKLETLARQHNSRLVTSRDQLNGSGGNLQGFSSGLLKDALAMPELLREPLKNRFS